jgi:hypothetical protein
VTPGRTEASSEGVLVAGSTIRQGVLRTVPHLLCRVKFRGVGRKVLRLDPGATREEVLAQLAAMNRAAIPQEEHGAPQMVEQLLEPLHHFLSSEGAAVELDVKSHPLALGRDCHRGKGVDAALCVPHGARGSLPLRRPGAVKGGDEQKAAFVQENQVRAALRGLFFSAANDTVANGRSRSRRADTSGVRGSDTSNPSRARDATAPGGGANPKFVPDYLGAALRGPQFGLVPSGLRPAQ